MITFHKLTLTQFEKALAKGNILTDGIYFLTDVGVLKLYNGNGSVTTIGTNILVVSEFPNDNDAKQFCIYVKDDTKLQKIWDGSKWQTINFAPVSNITDLLLEDDAPTTIPNTKAVANFVNDKIATALLGVNIKLHTPVQDLEALKNLSLEEVGDRCLILVESVGLYRYDKDSDDYDDPNTDAVITPNEITGNQTGRWIKMFGNMGYINGNGVSINANPNDVNNIISLNVNLLQFNFDLNGKLNIKSDSNLMNSKLDNVAENSDGKIIVGNGNNGKVGASLYNIGTDTDNLTFENIGSIPANKVATLRAIKWYVDRSLSFNNTNIDLTIPNQLGD